MINKTLHLYRGDDLTNERTKPAIYRSEGIVSGAFGGGGNPEEIERRGFLKSIKEHIDHLKDFEIKYYRISDYISFSESEEIAKRWASRNKPDDLVPTAEPYTETRYIFKLSIPLNELKLIAKGVYEFGFACNKNLKTPFKLNEFDPLEVITHTWALQYADCPVCNGFQKNHSIIVINPLLAFDGQKEEKEFKRSLKLAKKNSEWIILPNDIIDNGFRGSRIQPADFWGTHGYKMAGEEARNPFTLPYKGY